MGDSCSSAPPCLSKVRSRLAEPEAILNGALTGLKVIDWSAWLQGPVASMMLGDLGADIVKVEDPRGGDPSRGLVTVGGVSTGKLSRNFFFAASNRN